VVSTFYALQDTKTPVQTAVVSVVANIVLGIVLMKTRLEHGGLALATSLASMLNLGLLIWVLRGKLGSLEWGSTLKSAGKTMLCSVIMGVVVWTVSIHIIPLENGSFTGLLTGLMVSIGIGIMLYGAFSFLMKSPELDKILVLIFHRGERPNIS